MEPFVLGQAHRPQGRADSSQTWGCGKAPISRTWAFCQRRLENSGAMEANACTILGGRVGILRSPLLAETGDERILPFRYQIAKVELYEVG
jgi:hypothetical protein